MTKRIKLISELILDLIPGMNFSGTLIGIDSSQRGEECCIPQALTLTRL